VVFSFFYFAVTSFFEKHPPGLALERMLFD
jgi:hypothetical protein